MDLFEQAHAGSPQGAPLAERMRPQTLDEVLGQDHLLAPGHSLREAIDKDHVPSMILWGPPGVGKTTIARLIAKHTGATFRAFSAVSAGLKEMREVIAEAKEQLNFYQKRTILFLDEIHRFNKAQQDAFLPHVESGTLILIGATTENPSFEVISALLSRCQVYVLNPLSVEHLSALVSRALADPERGLGKLHLTAEPAAERHLAEHAHGDARAALNGLEIAAELAQAAKSTKITLALAEEALQQKALRYDRAGDEHFNLISALHKSVRGSDPDAALYWLDRMLTAGEEPRYLLRRMARMAVEDIGLADPNALALAAASQQAFEFIGLPEGNLVLAELVVYLALAPKSNALYTGYTQASETIQQTGDLPVPMHIRNAPTRLMKDLGYGKDYQYAHNYEGHWVEDEYLPDTLIGRRFYVPGTLGWEGKRKIELDEKIKKREGKRKKPGEPTKE